MKYTADRKSGLDPLFGLPVARDSKAMDSARSKNYRSDKRLEDSLKTIDHTRHSKIIQCQTRVTKTRDFLATINPDPDRKVVCPLGLSSEEKQTLRLLRRGSLPSMSLQEFDEKLSTARLNRDITAASEQRVRDNITEPQLSEFKLKRKLFSCNSKKYHLSQSTSDISRSLVDSVPLTRNPLYRCKSVMGGAYQRLTSADVKKSNLNEHVGKISELDKDVSRANGTARSCRRKTGIPSDLEKDIRQFNSTARSSRRKTGTPPSDHQRMRRRQTVSDLKSLQDTSNSSSDSSGLTDEERYERFLTVLKGETTRLPDIFSPR